MILKNNIHISHDFLIIYIILTIIYLYLYLYFTVEDKDPSKNIDSEHEDDIC